MATASLIHASCGYSLRLGGSNNRNGAHGPLGSSTSFSCSCCSSTNLNFSSGINNWKQQGLKAQTMGTTTQESFASSRGTLNGKNKPDHLLVLVHGILASPSDWTYAEAELKRRLGSNFLIYASSSNTYTRTFSGIDGAGKRLANEVMEVVKKTDSLKRISFLAHSLGGLFARYAVAVLYSSTAEESGEPVDLADSMRENSLTMCSSRRGTIAGLEPVNFITLATPHLGVRGKKQLPFLFGVSFLEKLALPLAPILVGQTGSQLFLMDGRPDKPPLLLRMASDCEDGKFLSALGAFRCRIVYANVSYDLNGQPPRRSLDGYKHVVDVEYCPPVSSDGPHFTSEAIKAKEAAQNEPNAQNTSEYHVKNEWLHNAGTGVIAHVADSLRQQESSSFIAASL
ncbi:hypothetical protein CUMW_012950 [Citrus unshiu]|nr:hypothetical protein CUMW_012950 [Citrus unshiu]